MTNNPRYMNKVFLAELPEPCNRAIPQQNQHIGGLRFAQNDIKNVAQE